VYGNIGVSKILMDRSWVKKENLKNRMKSREEGPTE